MAQYDVKEILENLEEAVAHADDVDSDRELVKRRREARKRRSLYQRLEGDSLQRLKEFHAVDRIPEGARFGFLKKAFSRLLRIVSAPQAAYNWNNLQAIQAMAYEIDTLRERMEVLENGPARPLGVSRLGGADTTRLANLMEQHLIGLQEHVGHMSNNMGVFASDMSRLLETLTSLSSRLSLLSSNQRESATDVSAARIDISRLWTEVGLVYESLDTRAEDVWAGMGQLNKSIQTHSEDLWTGMGQVTKQLDQNTGAVQKLNTDSSSLATQTKELRARLLGLTEQLALQQEIIENLHSDVSSSTPKRKTQTSSSPSAAETTGRPVETQGLETKIPSNDIIHKQLDLAYLRFQRQYRGDEEDLKKRQRHYMQVIADKLGMDSDQQKESPIRLLDVACGDGIFIELAKEAGWKARGVDLNGSMVKTGRSRGLEIAEADALTWLEEAEPDSFDAITCLQFVEHLTPWQLMKYLKGAYRALRPGGLILVETINPHTLKALKWFHLDLTHERLIFPEMLELLSETAGFQRAEWKGINPVSKDEALELMGSDEEKENLTKLNKALFGEQDYYLIAERPKRVGT